LHSIVIDWVKIIIIIKAEYSTIIWI